MRRNEQQKGAVMDWPQFPFHIPLCLLVGGGGRGVRNEGIKLSLGKSVLIFLSLLHSIQHPFNCNKLV